MGTAPARPPLTGLTIGVTAARRRDELITALRGHGARIIDAPTARIVEPAADPVLRAACERCLEGRLDHIVVTTAAGWHGWLDAADEWGLGERIAGARRGALVSVLGPRTAGAVRARGSREVFTAEDDEGLLAWLLARDLRGRRIAVQEHGAPLTDLTAALRARGADVVRVPVYRWAPPEEPGPAHGLVRRTARRGVHALVFAGTPEVEAFLDAARDLGCHREVVSALRRDVVPVCIGPACALPLAAHGVEAVWPRRGRLGALVRTVIEVLPARARPVASGSPAPH